MTIGDQVEITPEAQEFGNAIDKYKRDNRRPFPMWSEILEIVIALGYRRVAPRVALPKAKPRLLGKPGRHRQE